jgi:hypothetical protein
MAVTIGTDTTIVAPLVADYKGSEEIKVGKRLAMCAGNIRQQTITARKIWRDVSWDLAGESAGQPYYKLKAAYDTVTIAAAGAAWKPPEEASTTWTCIFYGWKDLPYKISDNSWRHKVTFTVEEATA